ncbi:MAG: diacylglycerol kinase family protein [Patescibacteria group bacterium]
MGFAHSRAKSFLYAFTGIKEAFQKEPNLRIHLAFAITAIILAIFFNFEKFEWLILIITIFFVFTLELLNTALEALVDLVSPEIKGKAKVTKDVSAAVVLFASLLAIIIGLILFTPKILALFG